MKTLNTSALALLSSFAILLSSCSGDHHEASVVKDSPVHVTVAKASLKANNTVQASGQIESKESAIISTRIMGFVTSIKVKAGDKVQKGQLLATISNGDIMAKRAQAQAMVTEAEAALKDAEKDYERYAELHKQQSASTKEFENITLHYNSVKAKTEAARQMKNEAEAMLAYTNLVAPFAGVVVQKNIDEGSMANPGMPLLVVEQNGGFQISASVTETDIDNVKEGSVAEAMIKSTGRMITGRVQQVSPSSQFSSGQYMITISIPSSEKKGLYSGMFANVSIEGTNDSADGESITLVPTSALIHKDQLVGLYTISESKTALLRWVRLGKTYGDQVEILSGLNATEDFILHAEGKLYNGVPVLVK